MFGCFSRRHGLEQVSSSSDQHLDEFFWSNMMTPSVLAYLDAVDLIGPIWVKFCQKDLALSARPYRSDDQYRLVLLLETDTGSPVTKRDGLCSFWIFENNIFTRPNTLGVIHTNIQSIID